VRRSLASPLVVVFLSGHGDIPVAVRAMQQGAVSWLEKPCSDDKLLEAVTRAKALAAEIALARRQRQRALQLWAKLTAREKQVRGWKNGFQPTLASSRDAVCKGCG
jgi:FixJ family two-component response regulator